MSNWIILDRDGVINVDSDDYVKSADEWQAVPGSIEAIAQLSMAGFRIAVATNQSGISRELFDLDDLEAMHSKLNSLVEEAGGSIAGIFYCPHLPDAGCNCRKPATGLLDEIESQFEADLNNVPFVGDSEKDVQAALAKGCSPVVVRTGNGLRTCKALSTNPLYKDVPVFDDLASFAKSVVDAQA